MGQVTLLLWKEQSYYSHKGVAAMKKNEMTSYNHPFSLREIRFGECKSG